MKVKLRCTDCLQDVSNITRILARNRVNIIKTKHSGWTIYVIIIIKIDNEQKLNELLYEINSNSHYGASVISKK